MKWRPITTTGLDTVSMNGHWESVAVSWWSSQVLICNTQISFHGLFEKELSISPMWLLNKGFILDGNIHHPPQPSAEVSYVLDSTGCPAPICLLEPSDSLHISFKTHLPQTMLSLSTAGYSCQIFCGQLRSLLQYPLAFCFLEHSKPPPFLAPLLPSLSYFIDLGPPWDPQSLQGPLLQPAFSPFTDLTPAWPLCFRGLLLGRPNWNVARTNGFCCYF